MLPGAVAHNVPRRASVADGARGWLVPSCPPGAHRYIRGVQAVVAPPAWPTVCVPLVRVTGQYPELLAWLTPVPLRSVHRDSVVHKPGLKGGRDAHAGRRPVSGLETGRHVLQGPVEHRLLTSRTRAVLLEDGHVGPDLATFE